MVKNLIKRRDRQLVIGLHMPQVVKLLKLSADEVMDVRAAARSVGGDSNVSVKYSHACLRSVVIP